MTVYPSKKDKNKKINIEDMSAREYWYGTIDLLNHIETHDIDIWNIKNRIPHYTSNTIHKLEERISELLLENEKLKKGSGIRRDVYEMLFDKCERLERRIKFEYESQIPSTVPTATFNYIPNNEEGQKLVDDMKQYLNKERYTLKERGQCINREKYSLDEVSTDRGIDKKEYGKFLKVHINEKRRK
jgi:predicted RNase H-like nuclease (RuvC/YqgF family)